MHCHMEVWRQFGQNKTGEAPALADITPYESRI